MRVYYTLLQQEAFHCPACLSANADKIFIKKNDFVPYLIELYSGSKTISKQAESMGFETFTIDNNAALQPDLVADIMTLKAPAIPGQGKCLLLWASFPCTWFTILTTSIHWKKETYSYRKYHYVAKTDQAIYAVKLLEKTLHLINTINPVYFIIENPRGVMRHLPQIRQIPFRHTVSYADYGMEVYKPTDLFHNIPFLKLKPITGAMGRQFTGSIKAQGNAFTRSIVPAELARDILQQIKAMHGL
jgi:hypothetical protein